MRSALVCEPVDCVPMSAVGSKLELADRVAGALWGMMVKCPYNALEIKFLSQSMLSSESRYGQKYRNIEISDGDPCRNAASRELGLESGENPARILWQ